MEPENPTIPEGVSRDARLIWLAGILGVAAVAYGARIIARCLKQEDSSATTAFDLDAPKYAWLR
jgi:hypothetical protein